VKRGLFTQLDLEKDNILKIFFFYTIPSILSILIINTYLIVDGYFLSHYIKDVGLATVNFSTPILNLLYGIGTMIAIGGTTLANLSQGVEKLNERNNYYTITILFLTITGLTATIIGFFFSDYVTEFLHVPSEAAVAVSTYIRYISIFFLAYLQNVALDILIRHDGFPAYSTACTFIGLIINVGLDYLFIAKYHLGVKGAAIATGISQFIPMVLMFIFILCKTSWKFIKPKIRLHEVTKMFFNGSSELFNNVSIGISAYIMNIVISEHIGLYGISAYSINTYIIEIATGFFWGAASAVSSSITCNQGYGDHDRVKKFRDLSLLFNFLFGFLILFTMQFESSTFITLFNKGNVKVDILAKRIMQINSYAVPLMGINIVSSMYFTSIDRPFESLLIAASRSLIFLVLGIFLFLNLFGVDSIWYSVLFAEIVTLIISLFLHKLHAKTVYVE